MKPNEKPDNTKKDCAMFTPMSLKYFEKQISTCNIVKDNFYNQISVENGGSASSNQQEGGESELKNNLD